jgi:hypothetical protein
MRRVEVIFVTGSRSIYASVYLQVILRFVSSSPGVALLTLLLAGRVNYKLVRIWKQVVVAYSRYYPGRLRKTMDQVRTECLRIRVQIVITMPTYSACSLLRGYQHFGRRYCFHIPASVLNIETVYSFKTLVATYLVS